MEREELFEAMARSVIEGEDETAADLARRAVEAGIDPLEAIDRGFVRGSTTSARSSAGRPCSCPSWCSPARR